MRSVSLGLIVSVLAITSPFFPSTAQDNLTKYLGTYTKGPSSIGCGFNKQKPEPWQAEFKLNSYDAVSRQFSGTWHVYCAYGKPEGWQGSFDGRLRNATLTQNGNVQIVLRDDNETVLATYDLRVDGIGTFTNQSGLQMPFNGMRSN